MILTELVTYLDQYLRLSDVGDAPAAWNGLQVENSGAVERLGAAVDACERTIALAAEARVGLLLVHHGLFWDGLPPVRGPRYRRLAGLIRHDIALYSAHLPLDAHPEVGNNVLLARELGLVVRGPFGTFYGGAAGVWGDLVLSRDALAARLARVLGAPPRVLACGPEETRRVGIVTGAGGSAIAEAAAAGLDTLVTGEGAHHTFFAAEELGVNAFYGGHYATETLGVKALSAHLAARFGIPWTFLDHPTGL
ncbi:MAG TPA: Nif3-like dinuclear metal center hexameric protein [Gemmatimonadales bacterium]|nr:Nif3-like dinuclear metal center hexameric protein [Gemmatimonadales bacterium]